MADIRPLRITIGSQSTHLTLLGQDSQRIFAWVAPDNTLSPRVVFFPQKIAGKTAVGNNPTFGGHCPLYGVHPFSTPSRFPFWTLGRLRKLRPDRPSVRP